MVRITEDLLRKRAEHNEGEIFSLEELSLHQQDIDKIENLDKWCRELKILYLQSNLISRIENVSRLKKLEYINLALNNIEIIENLENCESLKKLDLTVNFVGILTSIGNLKNLYNFEELYLTGNPCQSYDGYREYVITTLPQLQTLDGVEITKSERISAFQKYSKFLTRIEEQQQEWLEKRAQEKVEAEERKLKRKEIQKNQNTYDDDPFWHEKTSFTPESRLETHEYMEEKKRRENPKPETPEKPERRLFANDGRPYNVNESKIEFSFTDEEIDNCFKLDVVVYKYLDTSLLDCDIHPNYVRVTMKGKLLQLALPEEVRPDVSTATRSKTTGHLLIVMPKVKDIILLQKVEQVNTNARQDKSSLPKEKPQLSLDWRNIVQHNGDCNNDRNGQLKTVYKPKSDIVIQSNSPDFVDDPSVPPLE